MPIPVHANVKAQVAQAVGIADELDANLSERDLLVLILLEMVNQTESQRGHQSAGAATLSERITAAKETFAATR